MSRFFSVKNFEQFQHYKDRSPPWIKLYNSVLDDYEFTRLPDASRSHLLAIWLLASRTGNRIPYDSEWVKMAIKATGKVDLDLLTKSGFLVPEQDCSDLLADRLQDARPEREREGEQRRGETEERQSARRTPREELLVTLDSQHADAVIEHRIAKRARLTPRAAALLAKEFGKCPDPNGAADAMIANGWQGFKREWIQNRNANGFPNGQHKPSDLDNRRALADAFDEVAAEAAARARRMGT